MAFANKTYKSGDKFYASDMNNIMEGIAEAMVSGGNSSTTSSSSAAVYYDRKSVLRSQDIGNIINTASEEKRNEMQYRSLNFVVGEDQPLGLYSAMCEPVESMMMKDITNVEITLNQDTPSYDLGVDTIRCTDRNYKGYFVIEVIDCGSTYASLTLTNGDNLSYTLLNNTKNTGGIDGTYSGTGRFLLCSLIPSGSTTTNLHLYIKNNDPTPTNYVTFKILGVYNRWVNPETFPHYGTPGIYWAGDTFPDGTIPFPNAVTHTIYETGNKTNRTYSQYSQQTYTLPVLRGINGISDYIKNGKVYRRIHKATITKDNLYKEYNGSYKINYNFKDSDPFTYVHIVFNDHPLASVKEDNYYYQNGQCYYVKSPTMPYSKPVTSNDITYGLYSGGVISYNDGLRTNTSKKTLVLSLPNSVTGFNPADYSYSSSTGIENAAIDKIYELYSTWLDNNPVEVYYVCEEYEDTSVGAVNLPILKARGKYDMYSNRVSFGDIFSDLENAYFIEQVQDNPKYSSICGKHWVALGDSITQSQGTQFGYTTLPSILTKDCLCSNFAYGGASILCHNPSDTTIHFAEDIENLDFPPTADIFTIMLGINDRKDDTVIGTIYDSPSKERTATFIAGYKYVICNILGRFPFAKVFLCTNPMLSSGSASLYKEGDIYHEINKAIVEIGKYYDLPVIDLSWGGCFPNVISVAGSPAEFTSNHLFTADGSHYNCFGHQKIWDRLMRDMY